MTMPNTNQESTQVVVGTSLARVNLLPAEIAAAARFRHFQFAMGGAVVAAVVVVGALYVHGQSDVKNAQSQLDAATAQKARVQQTLTSLGSVSDVYAQVAAKQAMVQSAMGQEVRWSYYLTDLSLKVPDHVWLTNVTATGASNQPTAGAAATATSVLPTGFGSVTFSGVAFSHDDVATWLDTLAKERGLVSVYFTNSTKAYLGPRAVVDFSSSATLSQAALSGRYSAEG